LSNHFCYLFVTTRLLAKVSKERDILGSLDVFP
jgi:hypothetical protein